MSSHDQKPDEPGGRVDRGDPTLLSAAAAVLGLAKAVSHQIEERVRRVSEDPQTQGPATPVPRGAAADESAATTEIDLAEMHRSVAQALREAREGEDAERGDGDRLDPRRKG